MNSVAPDNISEREQYIEWCRARALELCVGNNFVQAYESLASDMCKNPLTSKHAAIMLGMLLLRNGHLDTAEKMREFIEGVR